MSSQMLDDMMEKARLTPEEARAYADQDTHSPCYWLAARKMDETHWTLGRSKGRSE